MECAAEALIQRRCRIRSRIHINNNMIIPVLNMSSEYFCMRSKRRPNMNVFSMCVALATEEMEQTRERDGKKESEGEVKEEGIHQATVEI